MASPERFAKGTDVSGGTEVSRGEEEKRRRLTRKRHNPWGQEWRRGGGGGWGVFTLSQRHDDDAEDEQSDVVWETEYQRVSSLRNEKKQSHGKGATIHRTRTFDER